MKSLKKLERIAKRALIGLLRTLLRESPQVANLHDVTGIRKVLVIRLEQKVGNVVMTTFFPHALCDIFPGAEIDVLVHRSVEPLWRNNEYIDKMWIFSHRKHLYNPAMLLALLHRLFWNRYDVVIDCSTPGGFSLSNGLLTRITGGKYRIGFRRGESPKFLNVLAEPDHSKHYIDMMHDLLRLLTPEPGQYSPELYLTRENRDAAQKKLRETGLDENQMLVLFWPGARPNKVWPMTHFLAVADAVQERFQVEALFLFGPEERGMFERMRSENERYALYIDDLRELAGIIGRCELFVSGDAGPAHLAAGLNVPMVTVFLQENYKVYGYDDGKKHRVVKLIGDPENVRAVSDACIAALGAYGARGGGERAL